MTTLTSSALPVPDQVITGSGSYTIPANRYGFINMSSSITFYKSGQTNNYQGVTPTPATTATSNQGTQWLVSGTSIDTSNSFPGLNQTNNGNQGSFTGTSGYARVRINSQPNCISYGGIAIGLAAYNSGTKTIGNSTGASGWSVSLFRIPKGNLPSGAAEGE